MKNFRKVLALILVVATLFSFVAMASAKTADEYKDYADVKYTEAVDVLTAIGITEGYDGAYHPADPIGRDEVAAMIARLRNGGDIDAKLYTGADKFFADVKGQWSEGYVTYCSQLGIVAGRNATTFDPTGKVTGTEVLKMLLCVLGFDAKEQGYVGANWQVNVVRDAKKAGLLIDGVDVYVAATRDEVAQYFLNALTARMVIGYLGEGIIDITNSIWVDFTKFGQMNELSVIGTVTPDSVVNTDKGAFELTYCNAVLSGTFLYESIKGLKPGTATADCFGRPGHSWELNGKKIGVYTDAPVATYTTAVELSVDYANGSKDPYAGKYTKMTLVHDGQVRETASLGAAEALTGNGVLTEVYLVNHVACTELRVVVIDTFMSKVTDTSKRYGWAVLENGDHLDNTELGAKVGDVVMYTECDHSCGATCAVNEWSCKIGDTHDDGYVHSASIVTPVTVKVDETHRVSTNPAASYIVAEDGTTYEYSENLIASTPDEDHDDIYMGYTAAGTTKVLYLDSYGYIQMWTEPAADNSYEVAYFVENTNTKVNTGKVVNGVPEVNYYSEIVDMEANGPTTLEDLDESIYDVMYDRYRYTRSDEPISKLGALIAYTTNAYGLYDDVAVANIASRNAYIDSTNGMLDSASSIDKWNGMRYRFNADTQYLIRTFNFDKGEYEYSAATGYKEVANYAGKVIMERLNDAEELQMYAFPTIQYLDMDSDGVIDYLFVDAFYEKTTSDYFYLLKHTESFATKKLQKFFPAVDAYEAVVNGEVSYVLYYGDDALSTGMYKSTVQAVNATYDGKPIYMALTSVASYAAEFEGIRVEDGQIRLIKDFDLVGHDYTTVTFLPAEYNDDLTVIVIAGDSAAADDLGYKSFKYTGAEFAKEFNEEYEDWVASTIYTVTNGSGRVTTLYVMMGTNEPSRA